MFTSLRTHPVRWAAGAAVVLAGLVWVAVGFFGVHTLFIDDVVDEAGPVFDVVADEPLATPALAVATDAETPADPADETAADPADEAADDDGAEQPAADAATTGSTAPAAEPEAPATPEIVVEATGTFVDGAHPTSGTASVLGNGTGQRFLRLENFETDNGPDLNVYLRDPETGEFVDLGDLKGNIGDQNYEIAADVDLSRFTEVDIWCVRFGVGFGTATLA